MVWWVDFVVHIKNGTALCEAMNTLFPGKVEYDENPIETFLKLQNINNFLNACDTIGLSETLFEAEDLNCGANVHSVLQVLALLSQVDAAKVRAHLPPPMVLIFLPLSRLYEVVSLHMCVLA